MPNCLESVSPQVSQRTSSVEAMDSISVTTSTSSRTALKPLKNRLRFYLYIGALSLTAVIIIAVAVPKVVLSEKAASSNSDSAQKAGNSYSRPGFDINTNWDSTWPDTGVTRTVLCSCRLVSLVYRLTRASSTHSL